MRGEPGRVGDGDTGPADGPFQGPLEVAVAGEPQPAALGETDPQPLHRWRRRGALRCTRGQGDLRKRGGVAVARTDDVTGRPA
jgi:hypothetical protein